MSQSVSDKVYEILRDSIITGKISNREVLLEQSIADEYGISKITARGILQKLCHEKYLICYPRKGYLVNEITPEQCRKIQQLRYQIEALALRLIARQNPGKGLATLKEILEQQDDSKDPYQTINTRFHLALAKLSGNEYIYDVLYPYLGYVARYAITSIERGRFSPENNFHREIVFSLENNDINAALNFLRLDLQLDEDEI
ncbi:transcriptional regulator [Thermoclostridium stercorarium subsp. stercorarium DSM 8532]|jgi:DNA-binding GntR family transcriptional regulator|uniref:Transcriptional regulator n=3 Tax=Thermoclostridium stercorarium TaxID=1510 RepID=L7VK40_THES1|nr:GntR family transcriptional regulator [Thermoclostridium stercorarium]AGC67082.1 transcriptional regulator [Thermoclostridium stercorarium subsp. stercorarium DSM 8532]AGI38165.1 transcriptional regulator [Thermoclostridium stercorarium subsp. stercorarium DSM 8532]ANW97571.1 transcriptional regulator [Thermoclostridium stercorarium subsp. thermolacticum DSM 2910]ANX00130.1 transcriptional regulator [Thermoclostridium stercorarium subsp. leptospartum DSM 9219]UZQ85689.1 GntR family transcri